jgi:hypothetical protein
MHFPANAGLIFLTDELTNDRYLVDTGATLSMQLGAVVAVGSSGGSWEQWWLIGSDTRL